MTTAVTTTGSPTPALVRRLAARVIDGVALAAVAVLVGRPLDFEVAWLLGTAIGVYAYFVVCDVVWGATLGKVIVGVRVLGPDGARPTVGAAAAREAFTVVGAIPYLGPVLSLAAGVAIAVGASRDDHGRGFHDRLAGGSLLARR